jgi:hypothetical protein
VDDSSAASRSSKGDTRPAADAVSRGAEDARTGSSRKVGRLGADDASSTAAADGFSGASRLGRMTTTAVITVIPMITAPTVSAFRFSRLASGGSGRSGGALDMLLGTERERGERMSLFGGQPASSLDQDPALLPVNASD